MKNKKFIIANLLLGLLMAAWISGGTSLAENITETNEQDLTECETDATHLHTHTNESGPDDDYWYSARIYKFRIYMHDDFMENVDLDSLTCWDGNGSRMDCDGGTSTADGGSEVNITYGDTSSDAEYENYVEWEYGITTAADSPEMPGYNDYDDDGTIDTSSEADRSIGEYLGFSFDEDITEGSATTTSEIWVKFYAYNIDDGTWEAVEDEDTGDTDWHWSEVTAENISNYSCPAEEVTCDELELSIATEDLSVSDLYSRVTIEATVTGSDGSDITSDSEFTYSAYDYGSTSSYASGDFYSRIWTLWINAGNPLSGTSKSTVQYRNTYPGDTVVVEVDGATDADCTQEFQFPYCTDLDFTSPSSAYPIISGTEYDIDMEIEAEASTGEDWPYDLDYTTTDSTGIFTDDSTSGTGSLTTDDWTVNYYTATTGSETVSVEAQDDVAGLCDDSFTYLLYNITAPECDPTQFEIIVPPTTISEEDMDAGCVEITWQSYETDGTVSPGPWVGQSTNSSGEFFTDSACTSSMGTGTIGAVSTTMYYTGEPGDSITVFDAGYPACTDTIDSEEPSEEEPYCEDMKMDGPYLEDGTEIDITVDADLETMYDEDVTCFTFSTAISDSSFTGILNAAGYTDSGGTDYNGTLTLEIDGTGESDTDNPATLDLDDGLTSYSGTVCWDGFEEDNYLALYVAGHTDGDACYMDFEYPEEPTEELVCTDLEMDPDSYTMSAEDETVGTIDITVDVTGENSDWSGTLILEKSGSDGDLYYSDDSASEYGDGHLEIPVSGTSDSVTVTFVDGVEGESISAYIEDEESACSDDFEIDKEDKEEPACTDLDLDPDSYTMAYDDEDTGEIELTIDISADSADWEGMLRLETSGDGELSDEEIEVSGSSTTVTATFDKGAEGDTVLAFIEDEESACMDSFEVDQEEPPPEARFCNNLEFDPSTIAAVEDEDGETTIELDSDLEGQTLLMKYTGCGGDIQYDSTSYGDELEITDIDGSDSFDITLTRMCSDAEIEAEIVEDETDSCEAEADVEILELGEFDKTIFTFNFAVEKSQYSEENIFFSHDEDRAFYTLEYEPAGTEEAIVFTDDMWSGEITGVRGSGEEEVGSVHLATTEEELTSGNAYVYSTILNFGFGRNSITGELYEENSETLLEEVKASSFMTFIPYLKYADGRESTMIPECEYEEDEDGNVELSSEEVCYDPDEAPETTEQVVIENAGLAAEMDGSPVIRVRYVGVVDSSALDCGSSDDGCLTLEFQNDASVELYDGAATLESDAKLVVLCSYLVTRNAGDVFLEVDLVGGSDISCIFVEEDEATSADFRNVDALVILEGTLGEETSATYLEDENEEEEEESIFEFESSFSDITVGLCDEEYENNIVGNLSSYVCEIVTTVSELWKKAFVQETTETRVTQATRNVLTGQDADTNSFDTWDVLEGSLINLNNPDSHILYFDGSMSSTGSITLGELEVPEGAWTLIVEDANLVLSADLSYAETTDYANIPSIAFVVLGGDIHIENSAEELVGVYYTDQSFMGDTDGTNRSAVDEPLTIYGSIYGHVQPLLDAAQYVGHPSLDEGGVVVRYDERILLNTPPALSEYVDVDTEKAVN